MDDSSTSSQDVEPRDSYVPAASNRVAHSQRAAAGCGRIRREYQAARLLDIDWDRLLDDDEDDAAAPSATSNTNEIIAALKHLAVPGQVVALWIKDAQDGIEARSPHRAGYFTDSQALAREAVRHSGRAAGCYVTVNPVARKALDPKTKKLARNKVTPYVGPPTNEMVLKRRRLLIDVDPGRPIPRPAPPTPRRRPRTSGP